MLGTLLAEKYLKNRMRAVEGLVFIIITYYYANYIYNCHTLITSMFIILYLYSCVIMISLIISIIIEHDWIFTITSLLVFGSLLTNVFFSIQAYSAQGFQTNLKHVKSPPPNRH